MLAVGRTFDIVTQSHLLDPHLGLRADLHATAAAWYLGELADRFCEERAESVAAYVLLEGLSALDAAPSVPPATRSPAPTSSTCSRPWATGPS